GQLTATASGAGLGGRTITFNGTGAAGLLSVSTNPDGTFSVTGVSPNTVGVTWNAFQINANFAGDSSYAVSSATQYYNTVRHVTSLTLTISPQSIPAGSTYSISGILKDNSLGKSLNSKTISFITT